MYLFWFFRGRKQVGDGQSLHSAVRLPNLMWPDLQIQNGIIFDWGKTLYLPTS
jgi:hypothetical protein